MSSIINCFDYFQEDTCKSEWNGNECRVQGCFKNNGYETDGMLVAFKCIKFYPNDYFDIHKDYEPRNPSEWAIDYERCDGDKLLNYIKSCYTHLIGDSWYDKAIQRKINEYAQNIWCQEDKNRVKFEVGKTYEYYLEKTSIKVKLTIIKRNKKKITVKAEPNIFNWSDGISCKNFENFTNGHSYWNKESEAIQVKFDNKTKLHLFADGRIK